MNLLVEAHGNWEATHVVDEVRHHRHVLDDGVDQLELLLKAAEQLGRALVRRSVAAAQQRGAADEL